VSAEGPIIQTKWIVQGLGVGCGVFFITAYLLLNTALGQDKAASHNLFATAERAAGALGTAYKRADQKAVARILGDKDMKLVYSGDPVIDRFEREWFLSLYREGHEVIFENEERAVLQLGKDEYPYPIPIVKKGKGWRFDPSEGYEDLLSRRISKTELSALDVVVAFVEAQRAYFSQDQDGDGVREYARKLRSSPDRHDGLYWKSKEGDAPSPLSALADVIFKEGYKRTEEGRRTIYRGYYYKILKAQGPNAPGGAREYVVDGKMTGGFALAAFPVRYGISGVLTFMVSQEGVVYQKDHGPRTVALGMEMTAFDPDETWSRGK